MLGFPPSSTVWSFSYINEVWPNYKGAFYLSLISARALGFVFEDGAWFTLPTRVVTSIKKTKKTLSLPNATSPRVFGEEGSCSKDLDCYTMMAQ